MIRKGLQVAVGVCAMGLGLTACDDRQNNDMTDADRGNANATGTNSGTGTGTGAGRTGTGTGTGGTRTGTGTGTGADMTPGGGTSGTPATPSPVTPGGAAPGTPGTNPVAPGTGDGATGGVDFTGIRDRAVTEWNNQLDELQPTIDRARERIGTLDAGVKNAAEAAVREAEDAVATARTRLDEIGDATEAGWQTIREETTALMERARTEVQELEPYTK